MESVFSIAAIAFWALCAAGIAWYASEVAKESAFRYTINKLPLVVTPSEEAGQASTVYGAKEADVSAMYTVSGAQNAILKVHAVPETGKISQLRIYSGGEKVASYDYDKPVLDVRIAVNGLPLRTYLRVEIQGDAEDTLAVSTPFYLAK